jgi:hypothetical protein
MTILKCIDCDSEALLDTNQVCYECDLIRQADMKLYYKERKDLEKYNGYY